MNATQFNPDDLLKNINKSILAKGIIVALIVHAAIVFGTSFGLYKDWAKYGVKKPSVIKQEKKQEMIEAEKLRREEEIKRKAEEAAIAASNAAPVKATAETKAAAAQTKDGEAAAGAGGDGATKKPPEIEPLPPASGDIDLGDIGF